jgi:hypothetical protein
MLRQVGLVSEEHRISMSELTRVAAALQKQAQRDFGPIWDVDATVSAFATLDDLPVGTWPVIVVASLPDPSVGGFHTLAQTGQPFALVRYSVGWPMTASHETLEMLADPSGNRLTPGDSPAPGQGRVEFVVEVCDPSEAPQFGYRVNDLLLSDFYTPQYFDPVQSPGVRYSFTGAITEPFQVLRGGYLSWFDPMSQQIFQKRWFGGNEPQIVNLSEADQMQGSMRERIDRVTSVEREKMMAGWGESAQAKEVKGREEMGAKSRQARAKAYRAHMEKLMSEHKS